MAIHQHHGEGRCDCPKLQVAAWVGPTPVGWHEPVLLVMPRSVEAAGRLQRLVALAGLRRGRVLSAEVVMAWLDGSGGVTVAGGTERIGPVGMPAGWADLAQRCGAVVLMLGSMAVPQDMAADVYLERHGDEVVTGLVPVAGATDRRCRAVGSGLLGSVPVPWSLSRREER